MFTAGEGYFRMSPDGSISDVVTVSRDSVFTPGTPQEIWCRLSDGTEAKILASELVRVDAAGEG
jgi:hypothetical protein